MTARRLEAFSDGVIAIVITIMVLELKVPHGAEWRALVPLWPVFLAYVLSFLVLGVYWNNHHHMFHATDRITGGVLWANLHLLFWLSLVPFVTGWMGENRFGSLPTALYGVVMLFSGVAYLILQNTIIAHQGRHSRLAEAIGKDVKGKVSALLYAAAIPTAFFARWVALAIYVVVILMWLLPDRRIESKLKEG
jgi:uncharacterized membrane protein